MDSLDLILRNLRHLERSTGDPSNFTRENVFIKIKIVKFVLKIQSVIKCLLLQINLCNSSYATSVTFSINPCKMEFDDTPILVLPIKNLNLESSPFKPLDQNWNLWHLPHILVDIYCRYILNNFLKV